MTPRASPRHRVSPRAESLKLTIVEIIRDVAQADVPVVEAAAPAGGTHD